MGHMSLTVLDMAQVFKLNPLGRCMDITHDWSSPSCPTTKALGVKHIIGLEYTSSTFKSYKMSFTCFITFVRKTFSPPSSIVDRAQEHIYFLLYWLNKHMFPNKSKGEKLE